jgi:hypothetical protein
MEFFAKAHNRCIDSNTLFDRLTIEALPGYSPSIDKVLSISSSSRGEIYSIWGQFEISREKIRNGVRFALLNCPHAFAWTISIHDQLNILVVHCTIDKEEADMDFVESIQQFVAEFADNLTNKLASMT